MGFVFVLLAFNAPCTVPMPESALVRVPSWLTSANLRVTYAFGDKHCLRSYSLQGYLT